ncbi:MAG TPA: hypothetical protein DDY14_16440 [Chromatiaceae bacterium]|jgi:hypothetical protein|nr:MAG: hypothetical protein N838_00040 [Thiohalocapsa sp. PB-PSB1]QQO52386.1 MAG: hypothetical protein N838_02270 [Thiohalocapsa sp. PB-PSB1]HBG96871.1 hypothetical protein [Chromatiaceae bacterium]HCS92947.1 hypothetical protein [Chromatiaceae bacterium]
MTRGIHLKTLGANDLNALGLSPDLLQGAMDLIDQELVAHGDLPETGAIDALAITREVRRTMEQVLQLLTDALPAEHR